MNVLTGCSVDGCHKPLKALGLCRSHYLRNWRHGAPEAGGQSRGFATEFIRSHINYKGDDCILWPFARTPTGYGVVRYPGLHGNNAHRVMCILARGEPPSPELEAAHECGNGHLGCVNPKHLKWKERIDNIRDKAVHGTQLWGDLIHFSKLTLEQAQRVKFGSDRGTDLAKELSVTPATIYRIRSGHTWKGLML